MEWKVGAEFTIASALPPTTFSTQSKCFGLSSLPNTYALDYEGSEYWQSCAFPALQIQSSFSKVYFWFPCASDHHSSTIKRFALLAELSSSTYDLFLGFLSVASDHHAGLSEPGQRSPFTAQRSGSKITTTSVLAWKSGKDVFSNHPFIARDKLTLTPSVGQCWRCYRTGANKDILKAQVQGTRNRSVTSALERGQNGPGLESGNNATEALAFLRNSSVSIN